MTKKMKTFSLIELIVVTSVLAILASLFYPSLSKALRVSQNLGCFENEKVIGQAFTLYVEDFTRFPLFRNARSISPDPKRQHTVFWDDLLGGGYDGRDLSIQQKDKNGLFGSELAGAQMYTCPLDDADGRTVEIPSSRPALFALQTHGQARSYSMNSYRSGSNIPDEQKGGITGVAYNSMNAPGSLLTWSQSRHNIPVPAEVFLVNESPGWGFVGAGGSAVKGSPLSQEGQGEVNWLNSVGVGIESFDNIRFHNGGWNYLFADGHVENMLPEDTVSKLGDLSNPRGSYWTIDPND
jgi:prepilin-type processing-associated H-X9-DG protein/prepilin-type N-terminal cleavage/methylation domain-containing protein